MGRMADDRMSATALVRCTEMGGGHVAGGSIMRMPSVPVAIFAPDRPSPIPLYDLEGTPVSADALAEAAGDAVAAFSPTHSEQLRDYLRLHLPAIASDDAPDAVRGWALSRSLLFEVTELAGAEYHPPAGNALGQALDELAREGVRVARGDAVPAYGHRELIGSGYTLIGHQVTTTLFAAAIAAGSGVDDHAVLRSVATCALFADAGKSLLPQRLWRATNDLSAEDAVLMREHPSYSALLLHRSGLGTVATLTGVLAHHDWWNGGTHPGALVGEHIPLEARCTAIADTYVTLALAPEQRRVSASQVVTRAPSPFQALAAMSSKKGQFDPTLLRVLVGLLGHRRVSATAVGGAAGAADAGSTAALTTG